MTSIRPPSARQRRAARRLVFARARADCVKRRPYVLGSRFTSPRLRGMQANQRFAPREPGPQPLPYFFRTALAGDEKARALALARQAHAFEIELGRTGHRGTEESPQEL